MPTWSRGDPVIAVFYSPDDRCWVPDRIGTVTSVQRYGVRIRQVDGKYRTLSPHVYPIFSSAEAANEWCESHPPQAPSIA